MPPLNNIQRSCLALAISQTITLPVEAATITVTNRFDGLQTNTCTLRQAIMSANTDSSFGNCTSGSGADTIVFNSVLNNSTITLVQGELVVTSDITINGPGQDILAISGDSESRVFYVDDYNSGNSGALTLNRLTITDGNASTDGGGILSRGFGASLSIIESTVSGNKTDGKGGGVYSYGYNASLNITDSTVSGNLAGQDGGGIYSSAVSENLNITNSTVSGNSSEGRGGGVYSFADRASLSITNSTVSGNFANDGGGVFFYGLLGSTRITNSTISGNSADSVGGVSSRNSNASHIITNSIISGNQGANDAELRILTGSGIISLSNNLLGSDALNNGDSFNFTPNSTNIVNIIATSDVFNLPLSQIIQPLADNGGPTLTHALPTGSAAIDSGDNSVCPTNDQRGEPRANSNSDSCDVGAFEVVIDPAEEESFFVVPLPSGKSVIFGL